MVQINGDAKDASDRNGVTEHFHLAQMVARGGDADPLNVSNANIMGLYRQLLTAPVRLHQATLRF